MSEKTHQIVKNTCLFFLIGLMFGACKKLEPAKFFGNDYVYFINNSTTPDGLNTSNIGNAYVTDKSFSFLTYFYQVDTLKTNTTYEGSRIFPLYIEADGRLSDKKRLVKVEVEGSGKDFVILPNPDSIYIPANGRECKLNLKIIPPPVSDTTTKTATIILKNNDPFKPEGHVWSKINYEFGNVLVITYSYSFLQSRLGAFSAAKMTAMQEAVSRAGKSIWETDANFLLVNQSLKQFNKNALNFDPFTLKSLYYFLDVGPNALGVPYGDAVTTAAYWAVLNKMVVLTKALIVERKAQNKPILDEKGLEISFP